MSSPILKYGLNFPAGTDALDVEFYMIKIGGNGSVSLATHYLNAHRLLWPEDKQHRWFALGLTAIVENKVTIFLGCANCVSGDTKILDPTTGLQPTIRELCEKNISPTVMTIHGPAKAGVPFIKGVADLYEVLLSDGRRFEATAAHRVLTCDGFRHVSDLQIGQPLFSYEPTLRQSSLECVLSTHAPNVPSSLKKVVDFQGNYSACSCLDDEQLLAARAACQSSSPSQGDAQEYTECACGDSDGLEHKSEHSHLCQSAFRPSIHSASRLTQSIENALSRHSHEETFSHGVHQSQSSGQSPPEKILPRTILEPSPGFCCTRSLGEGFSLKTSPQHFSTPTEPPSDSIGIDNKQREHPYTGCKNHSFSGCAPEVPSALSSYSFKVSHTTVVSIRKTKKDTFYDLCVPNIHHYFAEGTIHHNSGKTYLMSSHALIDFFAFPDTSLSLISSTDIRSLELRIWGRGVKSLFNRAKARYPYLPGYVLESKLAITPNDVDEDGESGRLLSVGITCVPCVSGGRFVGMSKFQGVKPPSSPGKNDGILKSYNDELAVMQPSILDGFSNWMSNDGFKGIGAANPTDISDPSCIASEPIGGWDSFQDNGKTQSWRSRWHNAYCIAFDGRDTPNNDEPKNQFPFLAKSNFVQSLVDTYGADSWQVYQQGIGKPSKGMVSNRVITIGLCSRHKAFDVSLWAGNQQTLLYGIDPAYGGGDRCVGGLCSFGKNTEGKMILSVGEPEIIPIRPNGELEPEEQIATYVKDRCEQLGVKPDNIFYDSFGRGTLGFAFAKKYGSSCPVPVDSGAKPTERPVRFDLYEGEGNGRRLKTCREHYSKFITEMWFSTREAIESGQIRDLPQSVAQEGQLRMFRIVSGNRIEVESKDDMKERIKKSPDLYDWFAICIEGARRLGFQISRIGEGVLTDGKPDEDYFAKEAKEWDAAISSGLLKH